MNATLYACMIMITVADVPDVEGDILELINRLAHKDNPCRLGSSSFDNEMCQIFTGKSIQYGPYWIYVHFRT